MRDWGKGEDSSVHWATSFPFQEDAYAPEKAIPSEIGTVNSLPLQGTGRIGTLYLEALLGCAW